MDAVCCVEMIPMCLAERYPMRWCKQPLNFQSSLKENVYSESHFLRQCPRMN